ncbi:MAG TPA: FRG domain-containing protein, partial [Candidatus Methylomirabilis sp.]|nr:FRG domain-containing protein [Candidatus Methylomirabilis sp.]
MEERNVPTWEEFIEGLKEIREMRASSTNYVQDSPLLFRGQGNACWQLSTTLERKRERMLYRDYYRIIDKIKPQIETLIGGDWSIPSYPEVERLVKAYEEFNNILWAGDRPAYAYMAYLRHHGFPSPLLDWSRSAYVAAYFAFANACKDTNGRVSVFVLCERNFRLSGNQMDVVHIFGPNVKTHRRHVLQQSQYTVCLSFHDEWRFESYDFVFEQGPRQQAFCWKFTIPVTERPKVLALLDEHNLNAFS